MRLFISYAHVDHVIVDEWLVQKLRAASHDVWIDESLTAGQEWKQQLQDAIHKSDALVYAMTPESIASEVCQWEVAEAVKVGKRVVPVLMQARTKLPDWLGEIQYVDFSGGATGDAVAKLLGGLQTLSPKQIPSFAAPPLVEKKADVPVIVKWLRDPAIQAILSILAILITIFLFIVSSNSSQTPTPIPTISASIPTPSTPIAFALRDIEIRNGPGSNFARHSVMLTNNERDIMGVSQDGRWYQILLLDGTTGWILASESGVRVNGNRNVLITIVPTLTPSNTPTETLVPSDTPTQTYTPSPTDTPSITPLPTDTPEPSITPLPTNTVEASATSASTEIPKAFPCTATVVQPDGSTTVINTNTEALSSSQRGQPTRVGDTVTIQRRNLDTNQALWYLIYSGSQRLGWIRPAYLNLSETCPL